MTATKTAVFPETLCRVTFNNYFADADKYLIAHAISEDVLFGPPYYPLKHEVHVLEGVKQMWLPFGQMKEEYRMVPLVHPDEWETIARWFAHRFRLLTIDASKIENLTHELLLHKDGLCHDALVHGEYFGKVPLDSIVKDVEYTWTRSDKPMNIPERAREFLERKNKLKLTKGYSPVLID